MLNNNNVQLNLNDLIVGLFCLYAFSMPFELILEYWFDIKTIFKPFRALAVAILSVYLWQRLRERSVNYYPDNYIDFFLYGVFVYGLFISAIRIIGGVFDVRLFYSDTFQITLHVLTFFVFKNTKMNVWQGMKILWFFVAGISANALYVAYFFFVKQVFGRLSGFTDNPNYAAFGLVAATTFLLLRSNYAQKFRYQIGYLGLTLFLIYIFIVTGSRTGLVMFILANIFIFWFSNIRRKLGLLSITILMVLILLPQQLDKLKFGGPMILIRRVSQKLDSGQEDVRFIIWRGVFRMLEEEGYAGMGIGQYKANFPKYYSNETHSLILEIVNRNYFLSTHNDYLAILADFGLPSLLLYLFFLFFSLKKTFRLLLYHADDPEGQFLRQFCCIIVCCIITFGFAAENFAHQLYWFLLMFSTKEWR